MTRPGEEVDDFAGRLVADPYRHLEAADSPVTEAWVQAQQELAEDHLSACSGQPELLALLRSLLRRPPASPSKTAGERHFRVGRRADEAAWALEVGDGTDDGWRPLIERSALGNDAAISRWQPSPGGRFIAVQVVEAGAETTTPLSVIDVSDGAVLQTLGLVRYAPVEWRADESSFCYVRRHLDAPGSGVYWHRVGAEACEDQLVIGHSDPMMRYSVDLWHDRWLVIGVRRGAGLRLATIVQDLQEPSSTPRELPRLGKGSTAVLIDSAGRLLVSSTDSAEFGEVLLAKSPEDAFGDRWSPFIGPVPLATLAAITLLPAGGDHSELLVVLRTRDGYSELAIHDAASGRHVIDVCLPGQGTVTSMRPGKAGTLTITYTDWATPMSIWTVDTRTGGCSSTDPEARARQEITVTRSTFTAPDGVQVPITVLTRDDDDAASGPKPTLLTCYGGFGLSVSPSFQPDSLTWVLAGGRMAIAGVRGGGDRGKRWHRAGSGANKMTSFTDLHAAGDWLVAEQWSRRDQLALLGGSNGGLLAAGAVVQRPRNYAALASAGAPLDMVRYPLSGLGRAWLEEYGAPDDPASLEVLLQFSPYHNVRDAPGSWPAALFSVGSNDTRVDPLHSRKMVARLQAETTGTKPILLTVMDGAGHVGAFNARAEQLAVRLLAFLAHHTGLVLDGERRRTRSSV